MKVLVMKSIADNTTASTKALERILKDLLYWITGCELSTRAPHDHLIYINMPRR